MTTVPDRELLASRVLKLSGGGKLPMVGFGTYLLDNDGAAEAVETALKAGYRHIDTAEFYNNHAGIARAIKAAGVSRSDLFITDKFSPGWPKTLGGPGGVTAAQVRSTLDENLARLETDYVDLYLIHHPGCLEERRMHYETLLELKAAGKARAIGVSNFSIAHLQELEDAGLPPPEANQIETHPLHLAQDLVDYCSSRNIRVIAYSSLAPAPSWRKEDGPQSSSKDSSHISHEEVVQTLADAYEVSVAQLLLKWALQKGYAILPKSRTAERIQQNACLFHFQIGQEHMQQLDSLNQDRAFAWPMGNPLQWA